MSDYQVAHTARKGAAKEKPLPESDKKTLDPNYLLGHENHFDPNVYTPDNIYNPGVSSDSHGRREPNPVLTKT